MIIHSLVRDLFDPATPLGALLYGLVFLALSQIAVRAVRFLVKEAVAHDRGRLIDATVVSFTGQLLHIGVYIVAFTLYAHLIPALRSLGTAMLTGVSIASVVIGLAAQGTLANLVGGVALLLYRPFRLGDRVQFTATAGIESGAVDRITLGYTILRTLDGRRIVVPNSAMINQSVVNLTGPDRRVMALVPIHLDHAPDIDKARVVLLELAGKHRLVREVIGCPVVPSTDAGVGLSLRAWCADADEARQAEMDLYEEARKRFDREQIAAH